MVRYFRLGVVFRMDRPTGARIRSSPAKHDGERPVPSPMAAKPRNNAERHRIHVGRTFDVLLERGLDGWIVASVPAMPGCHTQGKTKAQALERIREAIHLCLQSGQLPEEGVAVVGLERVTVEG